MNKRANFLLSAYSAAHFLVDLACILLMSRLAAGAFGPPRLFFWEYALLYNFTAFALQAPLGVLLDRTEKSGFFSAAGCALIALGWLLPLPLLARVLTVGLGNALFHIGGGVSVMRRSPRYSAGRVGIFVSTGALGVFLGNRLHRGGTLLSLLLLAFALLFLLADRKSPAEKQSFRSFRPAELLAMAALFLTVLLRSMLGSALAYSWDPAVLALVSVLGVVLGKALGGLVGDRLGFRKSALLSLLGAGALFALSFVWQPLALPAQLLFNMTMPLTVTALSRRLDAMHGFAFGLTTLALFLGTLPSLFQADGWLFSPLGLGAVCVLSLLLLLFGLHNSRRQST